MTSAYCLQIHVSICSIYIVHIVSKETPTQPYTATHGVRLAVVVLIVVICDIFDFWFVECYSRAVALA